MSRKEQTLEIEKAEEIEDHYGGRSTRNHCCGWKWMELRVLQNMIPQMPVEDKVVL